MGNDFNYLSSMEERELIILAKNGNVDAKEKLIESLYGMVRSIACKKIVNYPFLHLDDLIQNGIVGVMVSIERFELDKGFRLSTYAYNWIRKYIDDYILGNKSNIRITHNKMVEYNVYRNFISNYMLSNNKSPDRDLIEKELGFDDDTLESLENLEKYNTVSLDSFFDIDNETAIVNNFNDFDSVEDQIDSKILLYKLKHILSDWQYYVMYNKFFNNNVDKSKDIAIETRTTERYISKVLTKIYKELKPIFSKGYNIDVNIKDLNKYRLRPLTVDQLIKLYYIDGILTEKEFSLYYSLNYSFEIKDIDSIAKELNMSKDIVISLYNSIVEKIKYITDISDKGFQIIKDNFFETTTVNKAFIKIKKDNNIK